MAKLRSINAFIDENDRIPAIDAQNIFERLLAKSLERLRTEPAYFSCLAEIDCYKLLRCVLREGGALAPATPRHRQATLSSPAPYQPYPISRPGIGPSSTPAARKSHRLNSRH